MSTNPAETDAETSPGAEVDDASAGKGESNEEEAEETKLKEEGDDGNRIDEQQQNQTGHILWIALVAIFLRLFCAQLFTDFFQQLPLFSTPWSSLKRLREGIFLAESGADPYQGDLFHVMPLFLHALRPSLDNPTLLRVEWMILDFLCAYFLREFVLEYIRSRSAELDDPEAQFSRAKWLGQLAFAGYLLNPMTIGCWVVANLSAILNTLVAASLLFTIKRNLPLAAFTLALAIQLNPYYVVLFAPIFVQFADQKVRTFLCSVLFTALLFASNFVVEKNPQELLRSTIGFFLTVPDLTPNSGIFWYFFTQVFEHYRLLFLCVFQLNTLIYVVPLSALLRKKPALLASVLLITVALFSPYPSYAETALYLPTLAAFFDLHKYLRQRLITGCTILATFVLSPVMWAMWVTIGSGNANFFFAIIWVSNLAQIFISADLISSFLRSELVTEAGGEKEMEERFEGVRLFSASPL